MPPAGRPPSRRRASSQQGRSQDGRSQDGRSREGRSQQGRSQDRHTRKRSATPQRRRNDRPARQQRPQTAAERRAAEVNAKRPRRAPRDPEAERAKIESRTLDTWIDEGSLRDEAAGAASRAATSPRPAPRRRRIDPDTVSEIESDVRDPRRAAELTSRLGQAQQALDRERFDDARRLASSLLRSLQNVAAVHEVVGLAAYRTGRWKQAASELAAAQSLHQSVELLPVLADAYRALRRWSDVDRIWSEVREASPSQEVLAEARIVAAGALADQGDLSAAIRTMGRSAQVPKRVRDHHLRQWYVLADLHDRAGDTLEATRWFERVAEHDPEFVDVLDRLRALGR